MIRFVAIGIITLLVNLGFTKPVNAQKLEAYIYQASFYNAQVGPYMEVYLQIDGKSLSYKKSGEGFQSKLEVTYIFQQDSQVVQYEKFNLQSPIISDTLTSNDLIDVKRFPLKNGDYTLDVVVSYEEKGVDHDLEASIPITQNISNKALSLSTLVFSTSIAPAKQENPFNKGGLTVIPRPIDFYEDEPTILFYAEAYHSDKMLSDTGAFLAKAFLEQTSTGQIIPQTVSYKRLQSASLVPVVFELPIEGIKSNYYDLVLELRSRDNVVLIASKERITVSNTPKQPEPINFDETPVNQTFIGSVTSVDSMRFLVQTLRPKANQSEVKYIDGPAKGDELIGLQKFFYRFWHTRNATNPEDEWNAYWELVTIVNKEYGTPSKYGFETDRGDLYLKYGKPNTIIKRDNETSAYPYHIWHYYRHPKQSDARYIFYNPDLVTNDYTLLHSNVIGEISNHRWQMELQRRNTPFGTTDDVSPGSYYGSEAEQLFNAPR